MNGRASRRFLACSAATLLAVGSWACDTTSSGGSADGADDPGEVGSGDVSGDGGTVADSAAGGDGSGPDAEPGVGCSALSPTQCGEDVDCLVLHGAPSAEVCAGDYANWNTVPAGCMAADGGCGGAETCAQDPATGDRLTFPSGCIPSGWTFLDNEACCSTPVEPVVCASLGAGACAAEPDCAVISGLSPPSACGDASTAPEAVGCMDALTACDDALTCGQDPTSGAALVFPDSCLPAGWLERPWAACCSGDPTSCATLDPGSCAATDGCAVLSGAPFHDWCGDDLSSWMSVAAGCIAADAGCGEAETCGENPATGERLVFPSTCLPAGWGAVGYEQCCNEVPDAWRHCAAASDCQLVELECCDSCNGGVAVSVNAQHAAAAKAAFGQAECGDVFCTQLACLAPPTVCEEGLCGASDGDLPTDCAQLDESQCQLAPSCAPIYGQVPGCAVPPPQGIAIPLFYGGCMDASTGCGDFPQCGQDPATGQRVQFLDTCIPAGWEAVSSCCPDPIGTCTQGTAAPLGQLCVRGELQSVGESLTVGGSASIQLMPQGCFSSSCTIVYDASCSVTTEPLSLTVDGEICLGATPDDACTPDCSGGGWAECTSAPLSAGTWTVTAGALSLTVEVPSQLPFGGVCAGTLF